MKIKSLQVPKCFTQYSQTTRRSTGNDVGGKFQILINFYPQISNTLPLEQGVSGYGINNVLIRGQMDIHLVVEKKILIR